MPLDLSALDDPIPGAGTPSPIAATAHLTAFEEDPNNPRTRFDGPDFEAFVEDIKERGILIPIVVCQVPGRDKMVVRFGARRLRAARRLGLAEIPYTVTNDPRQMDDYAQVARHGE